MSVSGGRSEVVSRAKMTRLVESRCGAVALGRTYLLPPLSSGGALVVPPWLRFHIPLIEPYRQISRIRLSDMTSRFRVQRHLQLLNIYGSLGRPGPTAFARRSLAGRPGQSNLV